MKVKVLKKFRDKYTKKVYYTGDVIEVSEERFAEILKKAPLVERVGVVEDDKTKTAEEEVEEAKEIVESEPVAPAQKVEDEEVTESEKE